MELVASVGMSPMEEDGNMIEFGNRVIDEQKERRYEEKMKINCGKIEINRKQSLR